MDFASSTRAAENRTRWKGIVAKSSVMPHNLPRLWELKENKRAMMAPGRSPEYHWYQIISKSVHRLKLFSIYSPGGHFVQQNETV